MTTEERIIAAAGEILERDGPPGVTTRAVCAAADVTAPTLYHHFGDMPGLINVMVSRGIAEFLEGKRARRQTADPVADLRRGWDSWIDFALKRPALFRLMLERVSREPELGSEARQIMRGTIERMHEAGLLRVDLETASLAVQAASMGAVSILAQGASASQVRATAELLYAGVLERIVRPQR